MTTNLEWLYENDRETLITMLDGDCSACKFETNCWDNNDYKCDRNWLNAECVEPDSWEKIERDARQGLDYYYFNILCMGMRHVVTAADMHRYVVEDIINRCKALAGVE